MSESATTDEFEALLGGDALARLTERARLSAHQGAIGTETESDDDEVDRAREQAIADADYARSVRGQIGLRFAASVYGCSADPLGLTPAVWATWAAAKRDWDDRWTPEQAIAAAVSSCGPRLLEVPGLIERLATATSAQVRCALATAVPVSEQAVLRALATDSQSGVRAAANARICDASARGDAFPISTEGHDEQTLAPARKLLELPSYAHGSHAREAVRAMLPLSDALAVACWERLLFTNFALGRHAALWIGQLLAREGGPASLVRILAQWTRAGEGYFSAYRLARVKGLSVAARAVAFDALVSAFRSEPKDPNDDFDTLRRHCVNAAVGLAPRDADAETLVEAVLGVPIKDAATSDSEGDSDATALSAVLTRLRLGRSLLATMRRMRREGIPGRWARVSHEVWKSLGRDPVLRRRTFRELDSEDENVRYRGLRALLEEQRVPAEDGSKAAFARKLFARPALREPLLRVAPAAVLTLARRALLREELSIAALRAALDAHVDGADGDRVWGSLRSMRDRVLAIATTDAEERDLAETLVRTGGDWEASDLAVIRAAVARIFVTEDGDGPNTLRYLVSALLRVDVPESAEMLAMLTARATTDDQRGHLDATVRVAKAAIARSVAAAARAR